MHHAQKGSEIFGRHASSRIVEDSCYTTAVFLKDDYARFSDSKETGRARRRKLPINARDLMIPHGRLTRNCVHYRRIRFGSLGAGLVRSVHAEGVSYMTPKLAIINKDKIIFLVS